MVESSRLINLPLKQLVVFEAVSHCRTFAQAAEALFMTQSGVSQHIQELEAHLGTRLVNRRAKESALTEDGRYLAKVVTRNLKGLYDAVTQIRDRRRSLKIRSSRSFATRWLMPRLDAYVQKHPGVDAYFGLFSRDVLDAQTIEFDVSILYGDGRWEGYEVEPLVREYMAPLCRPELRPDTLADLASATLLHPSKERLEWRQWAEHFQVPLNIHSGLTFESMFLALNAATEGAGVAIGDLNLVGAELKAGSLVMPFPMVFRSPSEYWLVTHPGRENPLVETFRDWIVEELDQNQANFEVWEAWTHGPAAGT
jgi:LysR family glycine cleavage system transcriptional activator